MSSHLVSRMDTIYCSKYTEFLIGIDGLIVENMNDTPYVKSSMLGPEVIATMTAVSSAVRSIFPQQKPVGIQVLAGGNCEALAVAKGNHPILISYHLFLACKINNQV